ncbi:hypothetical protein niasHS_006804 [Heterodera schachtii]|uniref:Dymeclin n=1 Tax=Heterodera schachtii TaxID=97005 RepID=A0ABD2JIJ5_HETSC
MGCVLSAENVSEVAENVLLKKLAGRESMSSNDPQWNKMFSFNFLIDQQSRRAQNDFLVHANPLLEELLHNSRETANFPTLVRVVGRRCSELEVSVKCANKIFIWQVSNALLLLRYVTIFLAQRLSPAEFAHFFLPNKQTDKKPKQLDTDESFAQQLESAASQNRSGGDVGENEPEQFLTLLIQIITQIPVNALTVQLHAEAIRLLLSLLSTQLYEESITEHSEFLKLLMTQLCVQSGDIVRVLLENFLYHFDEELDDAKMGGGGSGAGRRQSRSDSFVVSLWSTLQRTLALGPEADGDSDGSDCFPPQSLSTLSLALLLSLVYYPSFEGRTNAYKQMLSIFQNAQEVSSLANLEASFKLDFTHLYNRLCATLHSERMPLLLLYLLLHNNVGFRNFVLSRINLEQLVLPVVRVLYDGMCSGPGHGFQRSSPTSSPKMRRQSQFSHNNSTVHTHQTYLALIVLLMLSEDDFFKKVIHEMTIKNIDWYTLDRTTHLAETTLGGLIVLVFSKTIQINTVRIRDRYFHMNSLATLANLASCFKQLSPLASQKLIGLLETMTKRRAKLIRLLRERAENEPQQQINREEAKDGGGEEETATERRTEAEEGDDLHHDITALEEGIRTVLEIVNACLCHNLRNNPNLIYTLLYKRAIFEHFHQHPMFQDLVWNIYTVINHFNGKVEALTKGFSGPEAVGVSNASVSDILEAIKKGAIEWPSDRLKKFPDLRFKYIEDDDTVDFFVPYIWRLINDGLCLQFDAETIRLFNPCLSFPFPMPFSAFSLWCPSLLCSPQFGFALLLPLSYLLYRLTRTALALFQAIFVYRLAPFVYAPKLSAFRHRWTVVTGGTDGIGKAYTFELARRGLRKFMLIGRNEQKLERVKEEIESEFPGSSVLLFQFDFFDAVNVEDADRLRRELAKLDIGIAVNSVGVGRELMERFGERPEADRQLFRVNAIGAAEFISAVLPLMERCGGGHLVVLSSSQGFRPIPLLAAYSAAKSFISFLSEAADREYANVSVQCLCPALVATKMTYYKTGSLFVVTPEQFAHEAVNTLGLIRMTSGCFNHEIQMLMRHLVPWAFLKHLIMPIYWHQQKRVLRLNGKTASGSGNSQQEEVNQTNNSPRPSSKIPTVATGGVGGSGQIRQRA